MKQSVFMLRFDRKDFHFRLSWNYRVIGSCCAMLSLGSRVTICLTFRRSFAL